MKPIEELEKEAAEIIDRLVPQVLEGSQHRYMANMLIAMYGRGFEDGRQTPQCVLEAREYRVWCQTHGFDCPTISEQTMGSEKE
jgi:hypothetical protein